jgi:hypothetical protein
MQLVPRARLGARILVSAIVAATFNWPATANAQFAPESQLPAVALGHLGAAAAAGHDQAQSVRPGASQNGATKNGATQSPAIRSLAAKPAFVGSAYGSQLVTGSGSLSHGPTAFSVLSCGALPGATSTNTTSQVRLPGALGRVGTQNTEVRAVEVGSTRATIASSETEVVNLLGGLITSRGLSSSAQTSYDGASFSTIQSSTLVELEILGRPVSATPAPNTRIDLTLPVVGTVGYVEVNRQYSGPEAGGYVAFTSALHVVLFADNPYLPGRGIHLWLGNSTARLTAETVGALRGNGFATRVVLANGTINSGPTSLALVPCAGGEHNNTIATARPADGAIHVGAATTRAVGSTSYEGAHSNVTQSIAHVDVLDGLVTADAVKAVATASRVGSEPVQVSDEGSTFVDLRIGGRLVAVADQAPGSTLSALDGAVQITFHKVRQDTQSIEVTMIEILVQDGTLGLPVGSRIEIGRASAGIAPNG